MALNFDASNYDNPTLDINLPEAVTAENVDNLTQPIANSKNGSSGFNFNDATHAILNVLDNGVEIWGKINAATGGAPVKAASQEQRPSSIVVSPTNPAFVFGLSTSQLLLIAGGLAAVLILPRLLRRA